MSQFSRSEGNPNFKRRFQEITRNQNEPALISFEHEQGFVNSRTENGRNTTKSKRREDYYKNILTAESRNEKENDFYLRDVIKENEELRTQRNTYLNQLNKNEDLLWKAREIISQARHGVINWQEIYKDDKTQNIFGFESNEKNQREIDNSTPVLGGGLMIDVEVRNSNKPLTKEDLDQDRNLVNQIKTLSYQNKILSEKNDYWNQFIFKLATLSGLNPQPSVSPELAADILISMKKMLEKNSDLQATVFGLEQKVKTLENQILENDVNHSIIIETEYKVENLEGNLQKLEKTPFILQRIEERFDHIQRNHHEKLQTIKSAIQRLYSEINKICINIGCDDLLNSIEIDPFSQRIVGKGSSSEIEIQDLIKLLNPSNLLKPLVQKIINHIYQKSLENFSTKVTKRMTSLENKLRNLEGLKYKTDGGKPKARTYR